MKARDNWLILNFILTLLACSALYWSISDLATVLGGLNLAYLGRVNENT